MTSARGAQANFANPCLDSPPNTNAQFKRTLLAIFAVALLLRLGLVAAMWVRSGPALELPDEQLHWELASNLADRGLMISNDGRYAVRTPAYVLLLWPFAEMGQVGILGARIAQCFMGAATAVVAAFWARAAADRWSGIVAGLLVTVDPFNCYASNLLLTEAPFTCITVLASALAWRFLSEKPVPRVRDALLAALLAALAVMLRPAALGWLLALVVLLPLVARPRARGLQLSMLTIVATVSLLLPWGARNYAVLGHFAWLSSNGGWTLYDGQGPQANGGSQQADFQTLVPELANLGEVEQDALLRRKAIEQMKQDPARVARLAWTKLVRTWNPIPNYSEYRRPAIAWVSAAYTIPILIGALASLRSVRRDLVLQALIWLPVVITTLIHMIYVGSVRYRVPVMPFLAIAAALWFSARARAAGRSGNLAPAV